MGLRLSGCTNSRANGKFPEGLVTSDTFGAPVQRLGACGGRGAARCSTMAAACGASWGSQY